MLTGMIGYLQGTSSPDISMATHQRARFNSCPKLCHERAVKIICKYLLDTNDKGIIFQPDPKKGLNAMLMLILLEDRLAENTLTQRPFYLALVLLFPTLVNRYTGAANFRLEFVFAQLKQNKLLFLWQ